MGTMPLYEYECAGCQKVQEVRQKISDAPLATCPLCGSNNIRKLISRTSFALKGTGWYNTDYRKSTPSSSAEKANSSTKTDSSAPEKPSKPGGSEA
jgi:putative FmdB family regulatory protein